jgi:hypothetical protein
MKFDLGEPVYLRDHLGDSLLDSLWVGIRVSRWARLSDRLWVGIRVSLRGSLWGSLRRNL